MNIIQTMRYGATILFIAFTVGNILAQPVRTEAVESQEKLPLNGIVERSVLAEKRVLPYQPMREADVFWEKRIWRVIDAREKMNLPFSHPEKTFFEILESGLYSGEIRAFSIETDDFSQPLDLKALSGKLYSRDTVMIISPINYSESIEVVTNKLDPQDIHRYRIQEVWYFDQSTSNLNVRILGIAPMRDVYDQVTGEFRYEQPLFWVYYPECRQMLARHTVFNDKNDADQGSWEELFERRFFSSYIVRENDIRNRRLSDYMVGMEAILESEKIEEDIFNFELDLWSY